MAFRGTRLQTGAVEFPQLELFRVDAVEAAHVEHYHVLASGPFTVGVRLDPARFAEWVMNGTPVELIVCCLVFAGEKFEVGHRDGGEQRAELAATRAIAGNDLSYFGLRFIADFPALAATGVSFFHWSALFCPTDSRPRLHLPL